MSTARELDQFYTLPRVARICFDSLLNKIVLPAATVFLEPSAGTGSFFNLMPERHRLGYDLDPRCSGVVEQDFLKLQWPADRSFAVTVGNPPFGKNASLAVAFFNHAAQFSDVIAFIVPKTFRKVSLVRRLDTNFVLVSDEELHESAFVFEGQPYSVPCCFQIWKRSDIQRVDVIGPLEHSDFGFVAGSEADFAVRRVGGLAGKVLRDFIGYSPASHYFIKSRVGVSALIECLEAVDWSEIKSNTAGNPSISKRELVAGYERAKAAAGLPNAASRSLG